MFNNAKLIKRYCKECGNVTSLQIIKMAAPDYSQTYVFIGLSILIIAILGLAKLYI